MLDDVKIADRIRDKAWEAFIKRKSVKKLMQDKKEFKFPLDGSYELWCACWEKAWMQGFADGYNSAIDSALDAALDFKQRFEEGFKEGAEHADESQ